MIKTGYHYTSLKNWKQIQKTGLHRYPIQNQPEIFTYFPNGVNGIWVWIHELKGLSHAGTVLYQASHKKSQKVVKLKIKYKNRDTLKYNGGDVVLYHRGNLENMIYHSREPATIMMKDIPAKDIQLVKIYDIVKLLK